MVLDYSIWGFFSVELVLSGYVAWLSRIAVWCCGGNVEACQSRRILDCAVLHLMCGAGGFAKGMN